MRPGATLTRVTLAAVLCAAPGFAAEPPLALTGATLVDGRGGEPVPDAVVVIRGELITCAGGRADCEVPADARVVDASGRWIVPGIVDAHVHFSQTGWADGRPDSIDVREQWPYEQSVAELRDHPERLFRAFLCSGVTAVYDVGGYPWTTRLPERAARSLGGPHVAAAGPLVSTLDHWLNLPGERQFLYAADPQVVREQVRYLASIHAHAVKVWYLQVEGRDPAEMQAAVAAAGEEAQRLGLPLIVHATELDTAKGALAAGAKLLVHSVWDRPIDDEFIELARRNEATYCPTLTVGRGYLRLGRAALERRVPDLDDPNGCVGPDVRQRLEATAAIRNAPGTDRLAAMEERVGERERIAVANLQRVAEAGISIAMGTDAGNPLTIHGPSVYTEMEAMQAAGMSPAAVLVASTLGGAGAMGLDDRIGTVEAGKVADLLIVAADPAADIAALRRLTHVVRGGVLHGLDELRP